MPGNYGQLSAPPMNGNRLVAIILIVATHVVHKSWANLKSKTGRQKVSNSSCCCVSRNIFLVINHSKSWQQCQFRSASKALQMALHEFNITSRGDYCV